MVTRLSRQQWTFCGVQNFPGYAALFMVNVPCADGRTSVTLVAYEDKHPVVIKEKS